jgi:hypothetical protein
MSITAKTFEEPLLRALATLSDHTAGAAVKAEDTYGLVFEALGIQEDTYGVNEPTGTPQTIKWVQWAFKRLRDLGLGILVGRGRWALTAEGVRKVRALAPVVAKEEGEATVAGILTYTSDSYHHDEYIRNVALNTVSCRGAWTSRSGICKACGLSASCRNVQSNLMSHIASVLAKEDAEVSAKTQPTPPSNESESKKVVGPVSGLAERYNTGSADTIIVRVPTPCAYCDTFIAQGEKALWVDLLDSSDFDGSIFHIRCFDKLKGEVHE